jgi:uncharacterized protein
MSISPHPQFVIKVSKYCNLRCNYCYEFPFLNDKHRMGLGEIRAMFENIKDGIDELQIENAEFVWHGGEPLMLPLEFYQQVAQIQREVFGETFNFINTLQTNLTMLSDRHVQFLKSGFFADVGVSFDVYGDQRVDKQGRDSTDTVLNNLQKLIDNKVRFGAIAVLAQNTVPKVKEIYRFFDSLQISHRFLAYYRSTGDAQGQKHGVDYDQLIQSYIDIFQEWLASERATPVDPIDEYVNYAVKYVTKAYGDTYDPESDESIFMIDVNGDVFNVLESYEPDFCYGNLFQSSFNTIAACDNRRRSHGLARQRMGRICEACPYFGACPGVFVANAGAVERKLLEGRGCPVRPVLDHIVDVFERTELRDFILKTHADKARAVSHPALGVA